MISHWQSRHPRETLEAENVIVGAGIAGASVAWLLDEFVEYRRCGSLILERSEVGAMSV